MASSPTLLFLARQSALMPANGRKSGLLLVARYDFCRVIFYKAKVINGWSTNDWVLGMLCTSQVCGTHRVNWRTLSDKRCLNIRLDKTISGHTGMRKCIELRTRNAF